MADWRGVLTPAALAGAGGPPRGSPCYGRIGALKPGDRA
ncbi:hypothetical protein CENSYa_0736 [Cenarchaeum symbiosum A]|uniref:Uncharacterized protein n=1 Tax=Cenarchaeum symbiosum (strain A) TaxID=414004 RepID=A0RVI7_CENSY|nr:hypothetical protein CENSYa_0721 [Cenarchaeum symbiosum A]ABK77369.1 hypothetical protein CENSYa_0736 [Cenarchaeum symbiosum A]